jgi:hypothetical protein
VSLAELEQEWRRFIGGEMRPHSHLRGGPVALSDEDRTRLLAAVKDRPETYRTVQLYLDTGLTRVELAELLGISEPAVRFRIHRALNRAGLTAPVGQWAIRARPERRDRWDRSDLRVVPPSAAAPKPVDARQAVSLIL